MESMIPVREANKLDAILLAPDQAAGQGKDFQIGILLPTFSFNESILVLSKVLSEEVAF